LVYTWLKIHTPDFKSANDAKTGGKPIAVRGLKKLLLSQEVAIKIWVLIPIVRR
jgi:hypothetical protein